MGSLVLLATTGAGGLGAMFYGLSQHSPAAGAFFAAGALLLLAGTFGHWLGLATTLALLFIILSSLGLAFPNAAALALVPFDHNIGSAAAMLGFLQIGVSGLASAIVGMTNSHGMLPITAIIACTSCLGLVILILGRNRIANLHFLEEKGAIQIP